MQRRQFLKLSSMAVAGAWLARSSVCPASATTVTSPRLTKFVQPVRSLGPEGIPVATPNRSRFPGSDYYELTARQFQDQLHPNLAPTTLRGYADLNGVSRHLGGVIVAEEKRPVRITLHNELQGTHPLPIDRTLPGAGDGDNRIALHLHGGFVPWMSDGGPQSWFSPDGKYGPSLRGASGVISVPDMPSPAPGTFNYYYPNQQSARLVWFHDHAMALTRLNPYIGLASAYILRDNFEAALINAEIIPGKVPGTEVPLIIQDKSFNGDGSLFYPTVYDAEVGEDAEHPLPIPSVVPEFFGDTMLVNGLVHPFVEVQPRRYRLRIVNACNARFLNLQLYYASNADATVADTRKAGPAMVQIGTEGGFLPSPVTLNQPPKQIAIDPDTGFATSYTLLMGPAERADIIVDFSAVPVGSKLILYNDAPSPFPSGDPVTIGEDCAAPDTANLLRFEVGTGEVEKARPFTFPTMPSLPNLSPARARVRDLTLNEDFDEFGRLIQLIGTNEIDVLTESFGRSYMDEPTEVIENGATEVWRIFNLTGDTHPMHFHLVNVLLLSRQPFDVEKYMKNPTAPVFTGGAREPDGNERSGKETVRMNPGECTTVIAKFDLPKTPFEVPQSPVTGGHEYVWHCHILEHEEHDMMRPPGCQVVRHLAWRFVLGPPNFFACYHTSGC